MKPTLESAIATFGSTAKSKLSNPSAIGQPEDQLRGPFENLLGDLAEIINFSRKDVVAVGETSLSDLKTRPDYSVTVQGALVGYVEIKAPGKGANPAKFKDAHDKDQWLRLRSLPNLIYTDGNAFSLWQSGVLVGTIVRFADDIESAGSELQVPNGILALFENFLRWKPIPPRNAKELAHVTARLCRFLRDEVTEQLALHSEALTALAADWRKLLFPDATDERFADGYAQAVTFGLLMARAKNITLGNGLHAVATELTKSNSLIGSALRLLTDNAENQETLKTSLGTLTRVLDAVSWSKVSKKQPDAWLYFYEDFLEIYDNDLRKLTGSYYTPPQVVGSMVRLVDDLLRNKRFNLHNGLASPFVTVVDPATGTGTFPLGILRKIAKTVEADEGAGSVPGMIDAAAKRLIAFEMQLGPFAVAQLRILAELFELTGAVPKESVRMFVTNTLGNPQDDEDWIPGMLVSIAQSRKDANKIKRDEKVTVVIGNPPYKEKAKGLGAWIEGETKAAEKIAPLSEWMPPRDWGAGAHSKHLRNLYVYFWRWATWKVFDHHPANRSGIVCYISVAGFLGGPGFQKMRDYLRRTCDDIWIIDCSPEGHQPEVNTRIFQGVQQPICIVIASRSNNCDRDVPANVHFHALPAGHRTVKFTALGELDLEGSGWLECPTEWRAPFLPASTGKWSTYPKLEDLFIYNGSGVMPGRTWVIAPDAESLHQRWHKLVHAPPEEKEKLFHPHLRGGKIGDKHSAKVVTNGLAGYGSTSKSVADEDGKCLQPVQYGFRSLDRQWIIPDNRLINQPNPELWELYSKHQIFITAPSDKSPSNGPALTITAAIPDLHHYNGRGGRIIPLWRDASASSANLPSKLLHFLKQQLGIAVSPEDFIAYIAATAAHSAFTALFQQDLSTPGLRIPITADATTFAEAAVLGRTVIWLHTFGERMVDPKNDRPAQPPRLPAAERPSIPKDGAISQNPDDMPNSINYDPQLRRLLIGEKGYVANVSPEVWSYEVSGKQVLLQWFSYRKKDRTRPIIGDRRPPSALGFIQPDHWLAEYTTELLNVLNVLGWLVSIELKQKALLEKICTGPTLSTDAMQAAGAFETPAKAISKKKKETSHPELFGDV